MVGVLRAGIRAANKTLRSRRKKVAKTQAKVRKRIRKGLRG